MDPLSLAASVAGLMSICLELGTVLKDYAVGVATARKDIQRFRNEVLILESTLVKLEFFLHQENLKGTSFNEECVLCVTLAVCRDEIESINAKLPKISRFIQKMAWPFQEKEILKKVETLRRLTQTFQFSLTLEGCVLLSRNSEDISAILELQWEVAQKMHAMAKEVATISAFADATSQTMNQVKGTLDTISSSNISTQLNGISQGIDRLELRIQSERERAVLEWLSPSQSVQKHEDLRARRTRGTGEWLFKESKFLDWLDANEANNVLLCLGGPGAGKTVLASLIIDHLFASSPKVGVVYHYCDYQDRRLQTAAKFLASTLRQLSMRSANIPQAVSDYYDLFHLSGAPLQTAEMLKIFDQICSFFDRVYIVVDGFDEVEDVDGSNQRSTFLHALKDLSRRASTCVTSRSLSQDLLWEFTGAEVIEIEARESDIMAFVTKAIEDDTNLRDLMDSSLKQEVAVSLSKSAKGMFLLPALQITTIREQVSKSGVRKVLRNLSTNLNDVFEKSLQRISNQRPARRELAMMTLAWISLARRPLSIKELQHALATRLDDIDLDQDNIVSPKVILESCSGLVKLENQDSTARFVHYTLQEYLESQRQLLEPYDEAFIANTCLTYSMFTAVREAFKTGNVDSLRLLLQDYPLLRYTAVHWGNHVQASPLQAVEHQTMSFLSDDSNADCALRIRELSLPLYAKRCPPESQISSLALEAAAELGLATIVSALIHSGKSASSGQRRTSRALHIAALHDRVEVAEVLLKNGAVVNGLDTEFNTPLFLAASCGNEQMVRLLLQWNANPSDLCQYKWTALHRAADNGHLNIVKLLVQHGANIQAATSKGMKALHRAAARGHREIIEFLLKAGCYVNMETYDGWTPLDGATINGQQETVALLLQRGAKINHRSMDKQSPLHRACTGGQQEIVKLLLSKGADCLLTDNFQQIPLHKAAKAGHTQTVKVLLEFKNSVRPRQLDAKDEAGRTPFSLANAEGNFETANVIREAGSQPEERESRLPRKTDEMTVAIMNGNVGELQKLIAADGGDKKVDVAYINEDGWCPLHLALQAKQETMVRFLLLDAGADVNAQGPLLWQPLHVAARMGNRDMIELCLSRGANLAAKTATGLTAMHIVCARFDSVELVKLLLKQGSSNNNEKNDNDTTTTTTTTISVTDLIEAQDEQGWRPLHRSAEAGHESVVRLLLEYGADDGARTIRGAFSAQACAARAGRYDVVEFLRQCRNPGHMARFSRVRLNVVG